MRDQIKVKKVIPLFEKLYPGAIAEFFFDQSSAHGAFASYALNAKEMNVNPGGKQREMHSTFIPHNNPNPALRGMPQDMCFPLNLSLDHPFHKFRGQPKGMKIVLQERGLLIPGIIGDCAICKLSAKARDQMARNAEASDLFGDDDPDLPCQDVLHPSLATNCCMRRIVSCQKDFLTEKPLLQIVIESAGHKCYFLPKFHCELNPIEMYWGWAKIRLRALADGTFPTAKKLVPELLDSCPTRTIRAFFRKSWRYMDAYRSVTAAFSLCSLIILFAGKALMQDKLSLQSRNTDHTGV